jgi:hypothetical protein
LCWFGHVQRMEETEFPKEYYIWIWKQQDGEMRWERMEE